MENKKKENSLRSLSGLYTVVIGVALSSSIVMLINPNQGLSGVETHSWMLFISFVLTLLPFYHGALRHLDDAYLENNSASIKNGALIIDFFLLFLHGMAFVVLSLLIKKPEDFFYILCILFFVDVVWGVFVHFGASSDNSSNAEWKWVIINSGFLALALVGYFFFDISSLATNSPEKVAVVLMVLCVLRSFVDYLVGWSFYFPDE
ncbi:MAG: hypothetical protein OQK04_05285 [Kangiellaceae bacterium]|nr:hypothetical protein [Kangiellaceae bacterium]MCW8998108.1 hypothetical protein [Kangiellaceae bacterium]